MGRGRDPWRHEFSDGEHALHVAFIRDALKDAAVWLQFEELGLAQA